jgi:hypothetical protein
MLQKSTRSFIGCFFGQTVYFFVIPRPQQGRGITKKATVFTPGERTTTSDSKTLWGGEQQKGDSIPVDRGIAEKILSGGVLHLTKAAVDIKILINYALFPALPDLSRPVIFLKWRICRLEYR